jgi:hypothetical protein
VYVCSCFLASFSEASYLVNPSTEQLAGPWTAGLSMRSTGSHTRSGISSVWTWKRASRKVARIPNRDETREALPRTRPADMGSAAGFFGAPRSLMAENPLMNVIAYVGRFDSENPPWQMNESSALAVSV